MLSSSSFVRLALVSTLLSAVAACAVEAAQPTRRLRGSSSSSSGDGDDTNGGDDKGGGAANGTNNGNGEQASSSSSSSGTPSNPGTPTTPSVNSTKGTGGPTGQNELKSGGGLSYIINAPAAAATKPRGLLVLLHGSTASNYKTFVQMMESVATQRDLIRVSVLAPNGQGWNEGNQPNAAELLHRVLQEDLFPKYDIDLTRVFFSGQSSGGGFLSSHFLPLHAKDYQGGAFLQCGAAPPFQAFTPDASTKAKMKLHFEITTGDPIWPQSYANAVSAYSTAGMTLTKDNTKPGGHCAFDQQQVIVDHIAAMLIP